MKQLLGVLQMKVLLSVPGKERAAQQTWLTQQELNAVQVLRSPLLGTISSPMLRALTPSHGDTTEKA